MKKLAKIDWISNNLISYYVSNRASAILSSNLAKEIGRVFAEYKDKIVVIDGGNKKEHEYLIPKSKVHQYGNIRVYIDISEDSLKDFEI